MALLLALAANLAAGTDLRIEWQSVVFPELPPAGSNQPGGVPIYWPVAGTSLPGGDASIVAATFPSNTVTYLAQVDPTGAVLRVRTVTNETVLAGARLFATSDGGYIEAGLASTYPSPEVGEIRRFSSDGARSWSVTWTNRVPAVLPTVFPLSDNAMEAGHIAFPHSAWGHGEVEEGYTNLWHLSSVDLDGRLAWTSGKAWRGPVATPLATRDGGTVALFGQGHGRQCLRLDRSGNPVWIRPLRNGSIDTEAVHELPDGDLLMNDGAWLTRLSPRTGAALWNIELGKRAQRYPTDLEWNPQFGHPAPIHSVVPMPERAGFMALVAIHATIDGSDAITRICAVQGNGAVSWTTTLENEDPGSLQFLPLPDGSVAAVTDRRHPRFRHQPLALRISTNGWTGPVLRFGENPDWTTGFSAESGARFLEGGRQVRLTAVGTVDVPGSPLPRSATSTPDLMVPGLAECTVELDGDLPLSFNWGRIVRAGPVSSISTLFGQGTSRLLYAFSPGPADGIAEAQVVVSNRLGTLVSPLLSTRFIGRKITRTYLQPFASNSAPVLYATDHAADARPQWFQDGEPIPGATGEALPLTAASTAIRHIYEFRTAAPNRTFTNTVIEVERAPAASERWRREDRVSWNGRTDLVDAGDAGVFELLDGRLRRLDADGSLLWEIPGPYRQLLGLTAGNGVLVRSDTDGWARVDPTGRILWTAERPEGGFGSVILPTPSGGFWSGRLEERTAHHFSGADGRRTATVRVERTGFSPEPVCDRLALRPSGGVVIAGHWEEDHWVDWYSADGARTHQQVHRFDSTTVTAALVCDERDRVHGLWNEVPGGEGLPRGRVAAVDPETGWTWFEDLPPSTTQAWRIGSSPSQLFQFPNGDVVANPLERHGQSWLARWNRSGRLVGFGPTTFEPLVPFLGNRLAKTVWNGGPWLEVIGPDVDERERVAVGGSPEWRTGLSTASKEVRICIGAGGRVYLQALGIDRDQGRLRGSRVLVALDFPMDTEPTNRAPVITVQPPEPRPRHPDEALDLQVGVSEWPGQEFAWYRNGQRIPGASSSQLHLDAGPPQELFPVFPGLDTYQLEVRRGGRVWLSRPFEDLRSSHPRESAISLMVGSSLPSPKVLPLPQRIAGSPPETWSRNGTPLSDVDLDLMRAGVRPSDSGSYAAASTNSPRFHLRVEDQVRLQPLAPPDLVGLRLLGDGDDGAYLVRRDPTASAPTFVLDHLDRAGSNTWSSSIKGDSFALAGEAPRFIGIGSTGSEGTREVRIARIHPDGRIEPVHAEVLATNRYLNFLEGRGNRDHAAFIVHAEDFEDADPPVPFLLHQAVDGTFRREILPEAAQYSRWESDWNVAPNGHVWLATQQGLFLGPAPWIRVDPEPFHSIAVDASGWIVGAGTDRIAAFTPDGRVLWNRKESARQVRINRFSQIVGTDPGGTFVLDREGRVLLRSPRSEERIPIPGTGLFLTGWGSVEQTPYFMGGLELQTATGQRISTFHPPSGSFHILEAVPTSAGRALFLLKDSNQARSLWSLVADGIPSGPRVTSPVPDMATVPFETVSLQATVESNEGGPLTWAWESEGGVLNGASGETLRIPSVTTVQWRRVQAWNGSGIVTSPWIRIRPTPSSFGVPRLDSTGRLELRFAGNPVPHRLEGSQDLIHWNPLGYLTDGTGSAVSGVGLAKPDTGEAFRFYRALEMPR